MNEELKIIIKAVADEAKKELESIKKELEKIEKQGEKAGKAMDDTMAGIKKGVTVAIGSVVALTAALVNLGKSSMDYQKVQGKVNSAFNAAGASAATASKTYKELYGFLGDTDKASEAAAHLAKLTTNEKELAEWTTALQGVYASYGDSLPIEGLTEAANETAKVGTVTGGLADALNWAGVNEDAFNASLAQCTSEQERQALIRSTLNGLYNNASAIYAQNNAGLIAYNQSQDRLNEAMASASKYILPLMSALADMSAILLQVLAPAIEIICNVLIVFCQWIATAAKAISAFFGGFSSDGASTTNTLNSVNDAIKNISNNAYGASDGFNKATEDAEKLKKATMGFDELNVVSSQKAPSGGSVDAVTIPEITIPQIDTSAFGFDTIKEDMEEVEKRMEGILVLVGLVGTALAAWGIVKIIKDFDKLKGKLKSISGTMLIVAGALLLVQGYSDAWANGINWENFALILSGIGLIVGGLALSFGPLAAAIGTIVGGIAMLVIGIKDLVENGYSMEAVIMVAVGAITILVGVIWAFNSALLANPITWIVAAIMALVAVFIILWNECDGFRQFWINLWEGIKNVFHAVVEWIKNAFNAVVSFFKDNWQALLLLLVNPFAGAFKLLYDNCDGFREFIDKWVAKIGQFFKDLWQGIKNVFSGIGKWFSDVFTGAWEGIKKAFSAVGSFFTGIWESIKSIFSNVGSAIAGAISGAVNKAINAVLSTGAKIINGFIDAINLAIKIINAIPGVNISTLKKLEVPALAKGGIVTGDTLARIGEQGYKEAVLPLERNTGWMDTLADKIAGRNTSPSKIVLMLDGKELGWASINSINSITKQTGNLQLSLI